MCAPVLTSAGILNKDVQLAGLQLTTVPARVLEATAVTVLNLSENRLTALPAELWRMPLRALSACKNAITNLPAPPHPQPELSASLLELRLNSNQFVALAGPMLSLTRLELLELERNLLASVDEDVRNLRRLKSLSLAQNRLGAFPVELLGVASLTRLDVAMNKIMHVPSGLTHLSSLEFLSLEGNDISALPCELGLMAALSGLMLSGNPIKQIRR